MTARENFDLLISGKTPHWIPFTLDVGASSGLCGALQSRLKEETSRGDAAEYFDYDFRIASVKESFGGGEPAAPLAGARSVAEIEEYPDAALSRAGVDEAVREYHDRGYPVVGSAGSIFERSWRLRGLDRFVSDAEEKPEMAAAVVEKAASFTLRLAKESAAAGIDVLVFWDDAGGPQGASITPALWRSLIKPAWKSVLSGVRAAYPRAVFFIHTCGDLAVVAPDLVELGFQIFHPLGTGRRESSSVKERWGERIVACATLDARETLSRSPAENVRGETSRLMDEMGGDLRCIVCPSETILPETPWENVLAFSCAARNHRFGRRNAARQTANHEQDAAGS